MLNKILTKTILLSFLLTFGVSAQGIYLGAGIGNTFFSSEIDDALDQAKEIDENSTAWKIFAGYHLTDFLNIEGGYRSFGSISGNISSELFETKTTGWDVEAVGRLKIVIIDFQLNLTIDQIHRLIRLTSRFFETILSQHLL